jgi:hypothetical protein
MERCNRCGGTNLGSWTNDWDGSVTGYCRDCAKAGRGDYARTSYSTSPVHHQTPQQERRREIERAQKDLKEQQERRSAASYHPPTVVILAICSALYGVIAFTNLYATISREAMIVVVATSCVSLYRLLKASGFLTATLGIGITALGTVLIAVAYILQWNHAIVGTLALFYSAANAFFGLLLREEIKGQADDIARTTTRLRELEEKAKDDANC